MRLYVLLAAVIAVAACGKDSTSTPTTPTTPTGTNAFSIVLDSGMVDSQKVAIGTVIPVRVKLRQNGSAAVGVQMNWTIGAGHGALSSAATATNAAGVATVNWTIGDTAGVNTLTATSSGASVTFTAIAVAGPASQMLRVSADSSTVVAGASLPLTAKVVDRIGNGAAGATVTWTATGGSLSATSTISGATGNVTSNFTTAGAGTYTVTATLPGKASVSFKVVAF